MKKVFLIIALCFFLFSKELNFYEEMITIYKQELSNNPNSKELKDKLGFAYFQNKEFLKALDIYKELAKSDKNYNDKIIQCYIKLNRPNKITSIFLKRVDSSKDKYKTAKRYADEMFSLGYSAEAIKFYEIALKQKSNYYILLQLAYSYSNSSKYDKAIIYFKKALKLKPDSIDAINALCIAYYFKGDKKSALEIAEKIRKGKLSSIYEYSTLSYVYEKLNMFKKAEKYTKEMVKKFKSQLAYESLVIFHMNTKKYKEAFMFMGELSIDKYNQYSYIYYFRTKNYKKAKQAILKLIKIKPNDFLNYVNLMEFELVAINKISQITKQKAKNLITNAGDWVQYDMLLLFEEISKGKNIDLQYLRKWKNSHLNSYGSISFWEFIEIEEWAKSFDGGIKEKLNLAIDFFKKR